MIEVAGSFGTKVYYGDGMRLDLLRLAGAETAKAILFCQDNRDGGLTRDAVKRVLEAFPQAAVLVRAFDRVHLMSFDGLDLAFAQREMFESAVKMGRAALEAVGRRRRKRSTASTSNIGCAIASGSSCRARPATCRAGLDRSFAPDRALPEGDG